MHWSTLPISDQIFTHIDEDTKEEKVFAVDRIREHVMQYGEALKRNTPIEDGVAKMIMQRRGIETPRLRRALRTKNWRPLLYLHMPDDTHLLVDGSHTYVAMQMRGIKWATAYVVPQGIWKRFTIEGLPAYEDEEALLKSFSGCKP